MVANMSEHNSRAQVLHLAINSVVEDAVLVAMAIRGVCQMTDLSPKDINRIELCVVEVVNNAIEHAYHGQEGHRVEVELRYLPRVSLELVISDFGEPMPEGHSTPIAAPDPLNPETWAVSGRGLSIVEQLMDRIDYKSCEGRNSFHMIRDLA